MKILWLSFFLLSVVSCATPMKAINQNEVFDTEIGFKILPPPNGPWYWVNTPDGTGYVLGRERSAEDKKDGSTVMAEVRYGFINLAALKLKNAKETLALFEKDMKDPSNTDRFKNSKNEFVQTKFKNADCMTFEQVGVDQVAKSPEGEKLAMSYRGLLCLHPKDQGRYVRLSLSQRRPVSRNLVDMKSDEKAFYNTLEFSELKGTPPK
jgi:hypothetical protein